MNESYENLIFRCELDSAVSQERPLVDSMKWLRIFGFRERQGISWLAERAVNFSGRTLLHVICVIM